MASEKAKSFTVNSQLTRRRRRRLPPPPYTEWTMAHSSACEKSHADTAGNTCVLS